MPVLWPANLIHSRRGRDVEAPAPEGRVQERKLCSQMQVMQPVTSRFTQAGRGLQCPTWLGDPSPPGSQVGGKSSRLGRLACGRNPLLALAIKIAKPVG